MYKKSISLALLVSPKRELDFRKRSKIEFFQMIALFRAKGKSDVPIEVYPLNNGKYYIADGVHRAKAAQLANLKFIDAIVYSESKPVGIGATVALGDIIIL